jgi:hypothetical protein
VAVCKPLLITSKQMMMTAQNQETEKVGLFKKVDSKLNQKNKNSICSVTNHLTETKL